MDIIRARAQLTRLQKHLLDVISEVGDEDIVNAIMTLLILLQDRIRELTGPEMDRLSPCPCGTCGAN